MSIAAHHSMVLKAGSPTPPVPAYWGLCFTAEEPNVVINMTKGANAPAVTLETSIDGLNWITFDAAGGTTPVTLSKVADKVWFRAGNGGNAALSGSSIATSYQHTFTLSGKCAASGSIMSLLVGDTPTDTFSADHAFAYLFSGCTNLTSAPDLPAKALRTGCYRGLFNNCSSLAFAPYIPAQEIATGSCIQMFRYCTSLHEIKVAFTAWNSGSTLGWCVGLTGPGIFYCPTVLGTNDTIERGASRCPADWTVINI